MMKQKKLPVRIRACLARLPPMNVKRLLIRSIPYLLIFYIGNRLSWLYRFCAGDTLFARLYVLISNVQVAFEDKLPSIEPFDLLTGAACACVIRLIVWYKSKNAKKYRQGKEYGSARWGTPEDIAPFIDPVYENNILLTATERLTMNSRPGKPKYARNKNVIVIGGSGSGKTRFYVKPNLMQMHPRTSYIVTDPKMRNSVILSMEPEKQPVSA